MTLHAVELAQARDRLFHMAARAHAGQPTLLTRHGHPYAAIVPVGVLTRARPKVCFLALRGSGKGLWDTSTAVTVASSRDERA